MAILLNQMKSDWISLTDDAELGILAKYTEDGKNLNMVYIGGFDYYLLNLVSYAIE